MPSRNRQPASPDESGSHPKALDPHAQEYPLLRLNELYASGDSQRADRMVDEIVQIFPGTETAAEALFIRSRHRRAREDHEGALWDLLDAADQGTGEWSLRAAFRAGVHCQLMERRERAQVVFERVVAKWPLTLTAARAAGELAYIHRGEDKEEYWEGIQVDILHRLVCDSTAGSDDDLAALLQAVEIFLEPRESDAVPRDLPRARSCADELLRRATDRGSVEMAHEAELALLAIETGRALNLVRTLEAEGFDLRLPCGVLN